MKLKEFDNISEEEFIKMKSEAGKALAALRRVKRGGFNNPEVQKKALETRLKNNAKKKTNKKPVN